MRSIILVVLFAGLIAASAPVAAAQRPDPRQADLEASAKAFVELLTKEEFQKATKEFDAAMKIALPPEKLAEIWKNLTKQAGSFKKQTGARSAKQSGYDVVFVTCAFEKTAMDVRVVLDANKQITGLFFQPAQSSAPTPRGTDGPSVELKTKTGTLHGTLDLPTGAGPFPAVVLIAGSGPTDRDGNQPRMRNDCLKQLGAALALRGIAVLRYDKRGIGQSATAGLKEQDLRFEAYVADAAEWLELLRKDTRFSRLGIVGHSEGSLLGMLAAKQANAAALVSLAGVGRTAPVLLREQLDKNLRSVPDLKEQSLKILDEIVAGRAVNDIPQELATLFRPSVQPYLISWFKYDPARVIATLEVPVLIVQGTTDIQVPVEDAQLLAKSAKHAELRVIEGMNHLLKRAASPAEQQAAYTDPALPLEPKVVEEISAFLSAALK